MTAAFNVLVVLGLLSLALLAAWRLMPENSGGSTGSRDEGEGAMSERPPRMYSTTLFDRTTVSCYAAMAGGGLMVRLDVQRLVGWILVGAGVAWLMAHCLADIVRYYQVRNWMRGTRPAGLLDDQGEAGPS